MKVTLEFEDNDLREMLTSYFRGNGFAVKNLEEVCAKFTTAYPEGLKVQAEIVPMEPVIETSGYRQHIAPDEDPIDNDSEVQETLATSEPMLSLNDLTDPEPRGRVVSITNTKNEFTDIINASKRIEQERRRP